MVVSTAVFPGADCWGLEVKEKKALFLCGAYTLGGVLCLGASGEMGNTYQERVGAGGRGTSLSGAVEGGGECGAQGHLD